MNLSVVPADLHALAPLAERFGYTDDHVRSQIVEALDAAQREHLRSSVHNLEPQLLEWLAGPESQQASPSREYLSFSALLRAYDEL